MRAALFVLFSFFTLIHASSAHAQYGGGGSSWDSKGWVLLGERTIDGRREHGDHIDVSNGHGRYSKVMIVVSESEARITDFSLSFAKGDQWHPSVDRRFRDGDRNYGIDLPTSSYSSGDRDITRVDFKYKDADRARIQVWAKPVAVRRAPTWESKGWTLLGERELSGYGDRERGGTIDVGKREGRFTKLTVVVLDDDLELLDFVVNFDHGDHWHPDMKQYFRENSATRAIDMPENAWGNDARFIKSMEFRYRNVSDGGRARIQVYGLAEPAETPWDDRGWSPLVDKRVDSGRGDDSVRVSLGVESGKYTKVAIVVREGELEMSAVRFRFGNDEDWQPDGHFAYHRGARARVLDLPGNQRAIKWIEMRYRGHARIEIFGIKAQEQRGWNSDGWTLLGEREVRGHGREVKDRIEVGHGEGKFSQMTFVVLDADVDILGVSVAFGRGEPWRPDIKHEFREGQRARTIDFPQSSRGSDERSIRWIDFTYANLPGEGHARVQVWAR